MKGSLHWLLVKWKCGCLSLMFMFAFTSSLHFTQPQQSSLSVCPLLQTSEFRESSIIELLKIRNRTPCQYVQLRTVTTGCKKYLQQQEIDRYRFACLSLSMNINLSMNPAVKEYSVTWGNNRVPWGSWLSLEPIFVEFCDSLSARRRSWRLLS